MTIPLLRPLYYVAALTVATTLALAADIEFKEEKSFTVKPGEKLQMRVDRGSINITTSKDNQAHITAFRTVKSSNEKAAGEIIANHKLTMTQTDGQVSVEAKFPEKQSLWNSKANKLQVRYVVSIPSQFNLDVRTAGGEIKVPDLKGQVQAQTAGGDIRVGAIDGLVEVKTAGGSIEIQGGTATVEAQTAGGDIRLGKAKGNANLRTSGGSIHIENCGGNLSAQTAGGDISVNSVGGNLDARTAGGSITATLAGKITEDVSLQTAAGDITLTVPKNLAFNLNAQTSAGDVKTELPISGTVKRDRVNGEVNGGGKQVALRTSGGSIRIHKQ